MDVQCSGRNESLHGARTSADLLQLIPRLLEPLRQRRLVRLQLLRVAVRRPRIRLRGRQAAARSALGRGSFPLRLLQFNPPII